MQMLRYWTLLLGFGLVMAACGDDASTDDGSGSGSDGGLPDGSVAARCSSDAECDNDQFCDGEEVCVEGACLPGVPVRCADEIECTIDRCSESLRECESLPPDLDGDGHPDATCEDASGEPFGDDCDDTDPLRFPGNIETCDDQDDDCNPDTLGEKDTDGDGFRDITCCNGSNCGEDCDDLKPTVNPNATEACDNFDNDCNGVVDEGVSVDVHPDVDRDGHGAAGGAVKRCPGTVGFALEANDCDDNDPEVFEGQFEICDDKDNNCDGNADEIHQDAPWFLDLDEDTFGDPASTPIFSCERVAGRVLSHNDCRDDNAAIHPAAAEACDGADNDCNGKKDFNLGVNDFEDDDGDDLADDGCGAGAPDCNDLNASTGAGLDEICDLADNDCDDKVDEQTAETVWYLDMDGDGWGVDRGTALARCEPIPGRSANLGDCRDDLNAIHPDADETCNGSDEDCDGDTDEGTDHLCSLSNAIAGCNFGACDVLACFAGHANEDDLDANGCEADAPLEKLPDLPGDSCTIDADCSQWDQDYCNGRELCIAGLCYYGSAVVCSGNNVLQGDYVITNSFHITQLASIEVITGNLVIDDTSALSTLAGLSNLKTIGGNLIVNNTHNMSSLAGLSGLTTVGGAIEITGNLDLTSPSLPALVTAGSLLIDGNAGLLDIAGFGSLATVYGALQITENANLTAISGFPALRSTGKLWIERNYVLATQAGFGALEDVLTDLIVGWNAHTAIAFPKLERVKGYLTLNGVNAETSSSPNLSTTSVSFPVLDYVGKDLALRQLWNLASLDLGKLRQVGAHLSLHVLESLTSLSLPELVMTGGMDILNNGTLASLSMPKLTDVSTDNVDIATGVADGNFWIGGNGLTTLSLPELQTIDGSMTIAPDYYATDPLTSLSAPKLLTVGGGVYIHDLDALTSISLNALTTVSGYFQVYYCYVLTTLEAKSLATIGGGLYIYYNLVLPTIADLGLRDQSAVLQLDVLGPSAEFSYNALLCQTEVDDFNMALTTNGFTGSFYTYSNTGVCQ
jgi:hypothetical protein